MVRVEACLSGRCFAACACAGPPLVFPTHRPAHAPTLPGPMDECRTPYPGGAPANVATGVARLGAGALFVSAIGDDDLGDQFVALLKGGCVCSYVALLQVAKGEVRGRPAGVPQAGCPALLPTPPPAAPTQSAAWT